MSDDIQIGDYVEVDLGMGLGAIGIVVTEKEFSGLFGNRVIINNRTHSAIADKTFRIHFLDGSTHTAFPEECRKLSGKELFKAKLSDDKRIYAI